MKFKSFQKAILYVLFISVITGCDIFSDKGEVLFTKGKYTIRKKNLISYYLASPDLYVKTEQGEVKINLSPWAEKGRMAQEKITAVEIVEISKDSLQIHFTSSDTSYQVKSQTIVINIKQAVDSILSGK